MSKLFQFITGQRPSEPGIDRLSSTSYSWDGSWSFSYPKPEQIAVVLESLKEEFTEKLAAGQLRADKRLLLMDASLHAHQWVVSALVALAVNAGYGAVAVHCTTVNGFVVVSSSSEEHKLGSFIPWS